MSHGHLLSLFTVHQADDTRLTSHRVLDLITKPIPIAAALVSNWSTGHNEDVSTRTLLRKHSPQDEGEDQWLSYQCRVQILTCTQQQLVTCLDLNNKNASWVDKVLLMISRSLLYVAQACMRSALMATMTSEAYYAFFVGGSWWSWRCYQVMEWVRGLAS